MGDVLLVQNIRTNSEEETFQGDKAMTNGTKLNTNTSTTVTRRIHVSMLLAIEYTNI
jgi:hypothetical protein